MCVCVCVCLHEEGLEEHYADGDSVRTKISIFEDTFLEDTVSVFQH